MAISYTHSEHAFYSNAYRNQAGLAGVVTPAPIKCCSHSIRLIFINDGSEVNNLRIEAI